MTSKTTRLIYLASPYSHSKPEIREERFYSACHAAALLMRDGHRVFSPIAHTHHVAKYLPKHLLMDWAFWKKQDLPMIDQADELWVLALDGWKDSVGVADEIKYAEQLGKPVRVVEITDTVREVGNDQ